MGPGSSALAYRLEEYTLPTPESDPIGITLGPDGNIWFTEAFASQVAYISPDGQTIMEFPVANPDSQPESIITGPDGNIWYAEYGSESIGHISPTGENPQSHITPTLPSQPAGIVTGTDGNIWYTDALSDIVGRLTLEGEFTEYPLASAPFYMANGPEGNIWFVEYAASILGRINPITGQIDEFETLTPNSNPNDVTAGPDGNVWFTEGDANQIGRMSPDGSNQVEFPIPTLDSNPFGIIAGADGNLWFAEFLGNQIAAMNTSGEVLVEIPIPTADSMPINLALDEIGNVWFTELRGNKIGKIIFALMAINAADFNVPAGTLNFEFTVTREQDGSHEDTVEIATAGGTAIAGEDYVLLQRTLTFSPGETEKTLNLQLLDNPNAGEDRSILLQFSNPSFGVLLGDSRTVTIVQPSGGGGCMMRNVGERSPLSYVGLVGGLLVLLLFKVRLSFSEH